MFGGNDPFMRMFRDMHDTMGEMDRMMNSMMDPFGMLGGMMRPHPMMGGFGMIEGPYQQQPYQQQGQRGQQMAPRPPPRHPLDAFGFGGIGGIFSHMENTREQNNLCEQAMTDPNSTMFSHSTMISMDGTGQPRIVEHSTRKAGDVREHRRRLREGEVEEMEIGHAIGDRGHVMEKKRDKDGNVRRQQRFMNMDEAEAEAFDREFSIRAERNMRHSPFGAYGGFRGPAIGGGRGGNRRFGPTSITTGAGTPDDPIVTIPDDDEDDGGRPSRGGSGGGGPSSSRDGGGPIIREISEEEAAQSEPKRQRRQQQNGNNHKYRAGME